MLSLLGLRARFRSVFGKLQLKAQTFPCWHMRLWRAVCSRHLCLMPLRIGEQKG